MAKKTMFIPWLRRRRQKSGQYYYYFEFPNRSPRHEIPLGSNLEVALTERQRLLAKHWAEHPLSSNELIHRLLLYQQVIVPTLDVMSQNENLASLKNLVTFLNLTHFGLDDIESPLLAEAYAMWRNPKLRLRAKSELSLLKRVLNVTLDLNVRQNIATIEK